MAGINIKNIPDAKSVNNNDNIIIEQTEGTKKSTVEKIVNSVVGNDVKEIKKSVESINSQLDNIETIIKGNLLNYKHLTEIKSGLEIWTNAIQQALNENNYVYIPYFETPIYIDDRLLITSGQTLEINSSTVIKLADNSNVCMIRNRNMNFTTRENNINIIGGIWDGNVNKNNVNTYNPSDKINALNGVGGLINLIGVDNFKIKDLSVINANGFAIHVNSSTNWKVENIRFANVKRDGIHVGNVSDFIIRDLFGVCGDDMVALNAWDWYKSTPKNGNIIRGKVENIYPSDVLNWGIVKMLPGGEFTIDEIIVNNIHGVSKADCFPIQDDVDLETPGYQTTPGKIGSIKFENIYCYSNGTSGFYDFGTTFRLGTHITQITIDNWNDKNKSDTYNALMYLKENAHVESLNIDKLFVIPRNEKLTTIDNEGVIDNINILNSVVYGSSSKIQHFIKNTNQINSISINNSIIGIYKNLILKETTKYSLINIVNSTCYDIDNIVNTTSYHDINLTNTLFEKVVNILYLNSSLTNKTVINLNGFSFKDGYPKLISKVKGYVRVNGTGYIVDASLLTPNGNDIVNNTNEVLSCGKGIIVRNDTNTQWKNLYTGATY